jgi:dihydroorotase
MQELTLTRPDDWHLHLRDGALLADVLPHTARQFARAIVMPNLRPPVTTTEQALAYRHRILDALPEGSAFEPLMTLYLTDNTPPDEIDRAVDSGLVHGVKLYPAGATTNSDAGVTDLARCEKTLQRMAERGMVFQVHGEVTDSAVDTFDREALFIEQILAPLVTRLPELKVVFEHITTQQAVQYVESCGPNVAASITPQHCLYNRNALFTGGLRPHNYCLPVLKRERHRAAVLAAASSGNPKFFLGTDSAPHARDAKESDCGCAGCYSAPTAMELYAMAFEQVGALDKLEAFAAFNGADFYGLTRNTDTITLRRTSWQIPEHYPLANGETIVPLAAGTEIPWQLIS